jgi:hypothetical protein
MAHESHQYRVLLATNEGALHISLYPDSHPAKPAQHFIKLVEDDVYDGSQLQSILPKFFVEFTPHKSAHLKVSQFFCLRDILGPSSVDRLSQPFRPLNVPSHHIYFYPNSISSYYLFM